MVEWLTLMDWTPPTPCQSETDAITGSAAPGFIILEDPVRSAGVVCASAPAPGHPLSSLSLVRVTIVIELIADCLAV